jgi:hypothetical protein
MTALCDSDNEGNDGITNRQSPWSLVAWLPLTRKHGERDGARYLEEWLAARDS